MPLVSSYVSMFGSVCSIVNEVWICGKQHKFITVKTYHEFSEPHTLNTLVPSFSTLSEADLEVSFCERL